MIFVTISKYPNGANFEASAYLRDKIIKKWPSVPTAAKQSMIIHCSYVGETQTKGTTKEIIIAPTNPEKVKVRKGLSSEDNFLVVIT